jgi:mono/diheme cytochrome c family protein
MTSRILSRAFPLIAALALGACGQDNTGDTPRPGASSLPQGTFLLFPNPQVQADGSLQTDSVAYANAYYAAIDPTNTKDTLAKWKAVNGFDSGSGTQVAVVFGDVRDLGYGRRMTMRQNANGTIAAYVENYLVETVVDYTFSTLNLDAAIQQVPRWHVSTNAIEFSPGPGGGASFLKFFQFDAATGTRNLTVDLDGRGEKVMPGPCLTCHGGRGDPLTPPSGGQPLFPRVMNSVSLHRGDAQARMQPFDVESFGFSTTPGFTRADQEAALKTMNKMVLCTYPNPGGAAACLAPLVGSRPAAGNDEWQGTAAALIEAAYGGATLPNATYADTFVPAGWAGQTALYQGVVAPACRTCHLLRGTANQSDIDFDTFAKFQSYADRIKVHVFDRGNMPLAKIVFEDFWSTGKADMLANFLDGLGQPSAAVARDGAGTVLRPGRPVAVPGPGRTIGTGATTLSAANSLFSTTYSWSFVSNPGGATLTNPNSAQPTFTANANGTYVVQLVTGNGTAQSAPVQQTLVVNSGLTPAPSAIRFSNIKAILQSANASCTVCHSAGGGGAPPIFYGDVDINLNPLDIDRNGDAVVNATDELWFYTEVRGRINFSDVFASPLLRKPSGNHHNGDLRPEFTATQPPGHASRVDYDLFLNWILNGAPF